MKTDFKIHVFCGTSNLCKLINKSFDREQYSFNCTEVKEKNLLDIMSGKDYKPDCIIVDKDIDTFSRDEIVKNFSSSKIILLPSLDINELKSYTKNVYQISEPFKLSELREVLEEIYLSKTQ